MTSKDDPPCAICYEAFLEPRILSCHHTFCESCLRDYVKKSKDNKKIVCPLCRHDTHLPESGVTGLLRNFHVSSRKPEVFEILCCEMCFQESYVYPCMHCSMKICQLCKKSHKFAVKLAGEYYPCSYSDSESGSESDGESIHPAINDDAPLPLHLILSPFQVRTNFNVSLVSHFRVRSRETVPREDQRNTVHCICTDNESCLVLGNSDGEIITYDKTGKEKNKVILNHSLSYLVKSEDSSLYMTSCTSKTVFNYTTGGFRAFLNCKEYIPVCIAMLGEKSFVLSSISDDKTEETSHGVVQIYNTKGQLLKDIKTDKDKSNFKFPRFVAVSSDRNIISVSDQEKGCVFFFSVNGQLIATYMGNRYPWGMFTDGRFKPTGIAFDPEGKLIIASILDSTLHVVLPNGTFLGYVVTRDAVGFGTPFTIAIDKCSNIWIGDHGDGTIRVYEITSFKNSFRNPSDPLGLSDLLGIQQ